MAKVSASTLVRRARAIEKAPQPTAAKAKAHAAAAKKLRRLAAKMRADERKAKRAKKAPAKKRGKKLTGETAVKAVQAAIRDDDKLFARQVQNVEAEHGLPAGNAPSGWQQIDPIHPSEYRIKEIRSLAKTKNGQFEAALRVLAMEKYEHGRKHEAENHIGAMNTVTEAQRINVVCAFIAEMEGIAGLNKGPLPRCVMVSGYTLARVVDALNKAGYTAEGKGGMRRV